MDNIPEISSLILKYINQTITDQERKVLEKWATESDARGNRVGQLIDFERLNEKIKSWDKTGENSEIAWAILQERLKDPENVPVRKLDFRRFWYIAAAVVLIAFSTVLYIQIGRKSTRHVVPVNETVIKDAEPGSNKAVLTLSNGQKIYLDNNAKGILAKEGNVEVNQDGQGLIYGGGEDGNEVFNTLTVPKGGQYLLILKDGTKVWLNSASSIRYPTVFEGPERNVEITGEVYFEVAAQVSNSSIDKKHKKPFIVHVRDVKIEVLGTHFNVSAYEDEGDIKTTLLEGRVNVSTAANAKGKILEPGEQAISLNGQVEINTEATLEEVMAWRNGKFYFSNTPLTVVMRQIARWYDVEIMYEGKIPSFQLNGDASRNVSLANLLKLLQFSDVKCSIHGKKLIVHEEK